MPDDIFLPPRPSSIPKLRWFEVVLGNCVAGAKYLQALAEVVPTIDGEYTGGPRERASSEDLEIEFNAEDPDHLLLAQVTERVVRKAYVDKLARGAAEAEA
jgi:hypothetical protein